MERPVVRERKPSADTLAAALARLGVPFVTYKARVSGERLSQRPALLLAGLAQQEDARLRISIIPLLMRHPELSAVLPMAVGMLPPAHRILLKLYYTAAVLLQQKYAARLSDLFGSSAPLPDLYSQELGIAAGGDVDQRLRMLADRHNAKTHLALNRRGTYEYAAERFLKHEERQRGWVERQPVTSKPS